MSAPSWWAGRLESLHGRLVEEAYQRGLAEAKDLAEVAGRFGYELGRKEAGEEIADAFRARAYEPKLRGTREGVALLVCATNALSITSQPSGAASEPRAHPDGHSDLPEDAGAVREPRRCPECGEMHVMGCPDCGADLDMRGHYPECKGLPGDGE